MPTLTSVLDKNDKEQYNKDTKSEELGESEGGGGNAAAHGVEPGDVFSQMKNIPVAGRPSDAPRRASIYSKKPSDVTAGTGTGSEEATKTSGGGVTRSASFSRRNSVDENASSLSVENFGGSQDNLSMLGRNPDKEMRTHSGRRTSEAADQPNNDNRYMMDNREVEEMERRMSHQRESVSPQKGQFVRLSEGGQPQDKVSFADLRRQKARDQFHTSGINITYTEQEKEDLPKKSFGSSLRRESGSGGSPSANSAMMNNNNQQSDLNSSPGKCVFVIDASTTGFDSPY